MYVYIYVTMYMHVCMNSHDTGAQVITKMDSKYDENSF